MASGKEEYKANFVYTDEVLRDFEAMYLEKTAVLPVTRSVLGLIGLAGLGLFALLIVRKGATIGLLIPAVLFGLVLLLSVTMGRKNAGNSVQRYRRYYLNKKAHFTVDGNGVELKISGQKAFARSKFKEIYNLLETEKTFFLEIKGRAFYIVPKDSIDGGAESFKEYLQKKCMRRFVSYGFPS